MRQLTIGIDGYNLAMRRGTGIATYDIIDQCGLDPSGITNTCQAILRARLGEAGPVQAERFSQAAYLARLEAMYASVLAGEVRGFTSR